MNLKRFFYSILIFTIVIELIILGQKRVDSMVVTFDGGWYYHDNSGERLGDLHVNSDSVDLKGVPWNEQ
jgi:hypothetical protein